MSPRAAVPFKQDVDGKKMYQEIYVTKKFHLKEALPLVHQIKCHLSEKKLAEMTPVIKLAAE